MIDIVTVVFRDELPVLKLQAQSIELYCQDLGIQSIYVVVNDNDSVVDDININWWGNLSKHVRILPRSVFSTDFVDNGWVSQQVLKLLASSLSYNSWSMVLDAKTIFVKTLTIDHVLINQDQAKLRYNQIQTVFEPAKNIVNQLFNINLCHVIEPSGVPFFFHNDTVRSMIAEITKRTKQSFPIWFQQKGMLTEFILYSGYILYRDGTLDKMCRSQITGQLCCNLCHSEVGIFDSKILEMQNTHTASIHRRAWQQLSKHQQEQYKNFLINRMITSAKDLV